MCLYWTVVSLFFVSVFEKKKRLLSALEIIFLGLVMSPRATQVISVTAR